AARLPPTDLGDTALAFASRSAIILAVKTRSAFPLVSRHLSEGQHSHVEVAKNGADRVNELIQVEAFSAQHGEVADTEVLQQLDRDAESEGEHRAPQDGLWLEVPLPSPLG